MRPFHTIIATILGLLIAVYGQNGPVNTSNTIYTNRTTGTSVTNDTTDFCKIFHDKKSITVQEAQEKVGPWFRDEFNKWESEKESEPRFWTWYYNKYFPNTASSIIDCKLDSTCSPVSCRDVSSNYSVEVQQNAYFAAESVVNFHNTIDMSALMAVFSDGANVVQMQNKHAEHIQLWMHAIIAVTVIASSGLTMVSSTLALQGALGAKMAMNAGKTVAKSSGLLRESLNFPSNVLKGINSFEAGAASYVSDTMPSSDYDSMIRTAVEHIMSQDQDMTTKLFDANMLSVLNGTNGIIANMTLVDIVQSGLYTTTTELTPEYETQLHNLWTASAIGSIWGTEQSYIVASDVSDGGCKADSRGHPSLKACLDEYPDKVFYVFFKTKAREGMSGRALMRGPPGHHKLKKATNFTMTDVVRSSMGTFEQFKNQDSGSLKGADGFQTLFGNSSTMGNGGGRARGLFHLPVCYTPGGEAITSINTKEGLNYPCMCSTFDFNSKSAQNTPSEKQPSENEEQESPGDDVEQQSPPSDPLRARTLSKRSTGSDGGSWTGDVDATHDFMLMSRMYSSGDFWQFCQRNRKGWKIWERHGNKCGVDKSQTWSWPTPGVGGMDEPSDEGGNGKAQGVLDTIEQKVATSESNQAGIWDDIKKIARKAWEKVKKVVNGKSKEPNEVVADEAQHPFQSCTSNPHTVVGCEAPNNDGYHENEGCSGGGDGSVANSRFNKGLEASAAEMVDTWTLAATNVSNSGMTSDDLASMMAADAEDLIEAAESGDFSNSRG
ncbi:hypothetical protein KCV07_g8802, partial [Aureobasidium melanogenum]